MSDPQRFDHEGYPVATGEFVKWTAYLTLSARVASLEKELAQVAEIGGRQFAELDAIMPRLAAAERDAKECQARAMGLVFHVPADKMLGDIQDARQRWLDAERDAARYRHLREHCQEFSVRQRINPDATEWWDTLCGDGMDEAVDAAMQPHADGIPSP